MTENPHMEAIRSDPQLAAVLEACGERFQTLRRDQVESLVFYLKAINDYYPKSENHTVFWTDFSKKLGALKVTEEQLSLQKSASRRIYLGITACFAAGAFASSAFTSILGSVLSIGSALLLLLSLGIILAADIYCFKRSILISKEQDRKYFLASIRSARACNELDWAGLFAYNLAIKPGPQSDTDIERTSETVAQLTDSLRTALYNDEFYQYSSRKLAASAPSDA